MRRKNLMTVWLSLFVLNLSACSRVHILDHEICGDKGELGASCFHMLSDGHREIPLAEWDEERFGMLCLKADAYANFKAALLKLCDETDRCTWEDKQQIMAIGTKLNQFKAQVKK